MSDSRPAADDSGTAGASRRLYVAPDVLHAGPLRLDERDHHYLARVLRMRVGDAVILFDGEGREALANVAAIDGPSTDLQVAEPRAVATAPTSRITVALAVIKGERMDFCVQKLVELGAATIAPVITERTVVRLDQRRAHKRHQRFVTIARGAARQSRRARVAEVRPILPLPRFLKERAPSEVDLIMSASAGTGQVPARPLRQTLPENAPETLSVLVGPEGGFTPTEVARATASGFSAVTLGRHILRAETAAVAVVAALQFAFGELAG